MDENSITDFSKSLITVDLRSPDSWITMFHNETGDMRFPRFFMRIFPWQTTDIAVINAVAMAELGADVWYWTLPTTV